MNQQPPPRYVSGAIDLGELKERARLRAEAEERADRARRAGSAGNAGEGEVASEASEIARVAEILPENFEADLVIRSTQVPVILLVGSPRSEASEALKLAFSRLVQNQEHIQWVFRYVDVDTNVEVAQALQVRAIPTVLALAAGRPLTSFEGLQPEEQLPGWIAAILDTVDGKLAGLPHEDQRDNTADELSPVEEESRDPYDVKLEEYLIERMQGKTSQDVEAAYRADATNSALVIAYADMRILEENKAAGFDILLAALPDKTIQQHLVELFSLCNPLDPQVTAARTQMASALF